jgi:hypothetical protein
VTVMRVSRFMGFSFMFQGRIRSPALPVCCDRAASGHAVAAPPRSVMSSRRREGHRRTRPLLRRHGKAPYSPAASSTHLSAVVCRESVAGHNAMDLECQWAAAMRYSSIRSSTLTLSPARTVPPPTSGASLKSRADGPSFTPDWASRPHSARGRGDGFRGGRHGARLARGGAGPEYLKSRAPARNIA